MLSIFSCAYWPFVYYLENVYSSYLSIFSCFFFLLFSCISSVFWILDSYQIYNIWYVYLVRYMISGTPDTCYLPWCRFSFNFPDTVICCTKVSNFDQVQFIYSCEATWGPKEPKQSWKKTKFKVSYLKISKLIIKMQ